ncbi:hypothetical protein SEA_AXYM_41 [Gordonia phage Axym]|uniref:Uncharacterized protein n=1 Tax=Gordonia phage Axym TaxID=2653715 RepID=A0A5Q2WEW2_9CAUD|nr:hypothetical protein SEA_AXYM_41 [Gordonia phage Axym]
MQHVDAANLSNREPSERLSRRKVANGMKLFVVLVPRNTKQHEASLPSGSSLLRPHLRCLLR